MADPETVPPGGMQYAYWWTDNKFNQLQILLDAIIKLRDTTNVMP